jgi:hypothetical protein
MVDMVESTRRRPAVLALLTLLAVLVALATGCSGNSNDDSAARNESNFNTRSIVAFGSEVPIAPGAASVTRPTVEAGAWRRTYEVSTPATEVLGFYQRELPSNGWTERGTTDTTPGGAASTWQRPGLRLDVTVAPTAAGSTTSTSGGSVTSTVNLTLQKVSR